MPYEEGRALIEELNALAIHPDLTYEHRWKRDELIVWDNSLPHASRHRV